MGERTVGVWVVGLEEDLIDPDVVSLLEPDEVVEDAAVDATPGDLARQGPVAADPTTALPEDGVHPLHLERHPAHLALGVGDLDALEPLQGAGEDPVDERTLGVLRVEAHRRGQRRVGGGGRHRRGGTDVHRHGGVGLLARPPQDVPVAAVHRGEAELRRVLGEGDCVAALGRTPADLLGGEGRIPQRHERQGDQPAPAGAAAPVVDDPVVVDPEALQRELLVVALEKPLAAEAGEDVGVVDRRLDVVQIHVVEAGALLVGAGPEILVDRGDVALLLPGHAGGAVEEAGGHDEILVEPHVAEVAVGIVAHESVVATLEDEAHHLLHHPRAPGPLARGELLLPEVLRLHHVIIDRDDERKVLLCRGEVTHGSNLSMVAGGAEAGTMSENGIMRLVYVAGPLFDEGERWWMETVEQRVASAGLSTFLPHRDNPPKTADNVRLIFERNRAALDRCDLVVASLNGLTTDDGTAWEIGYAHARGVPVIGLHTDWRRRFDDQVVNLMLECSIEQVVRSLDDLDGALHRFVA